MTVPTYPPSTLDAFDGLTERLTQRVRAPGYAAWRERVRAVGGCAQPLHLAGSHRIRHKTTGAELFAKTGTVFTPCGNRRESVCPACSDRYAADAFHLIRAGLCGGKTVPSSVATKPRLFVTLTAPSFGPVHSRRLSARGHTIPCRCGQRHHTDDPRIGTALDLDTYDYTGAVLWQAHAGALWHRFTIQLRRTLAKAAGITDRAFPFHARVSYAKVAEYQRRGLVHFHAVIRLDGPNGAHDPVPGWATPDMLTDAVHVAAAETTVTATLPASAGASARHTFRWGSQVDIRPITAATDTGESAGMTDYALAGYIAKYATKGTDSTAAADRPIRSEMDIEHLPTTEHHRQMMRTCWDLGGHPKLRYLRTWAHMLGFRGHFLTKSRHYSVLFGHLRDTRTAHQRAATLARLGVTEDQVIVTNHWNHTGAGYRDDAERELALAIHETTRQQRRHAYQDQEITA